MEKIKNYIEKGYWSLVFVSKEFYSIGICNVAVVDNRLVITLAAINPSIGKKSLPKDLLINGIPFDIFEADTIISGNRTGALINSKKYGVIEMVRVAL